MKHAFLIISHNEFEILQLLIDKLDSDRTDIYVHIDKKVKKLPKLHTRYSDLHILEDRVDVRWGHYSQIACEMKLFEAAHRNGPYQHYHMLSGVHLPLKPVGELLAFYDDHQGEEIMDLWETCTGKGNIKLGKWNFWNKNLRNPSSRIYSISWFSWRWTMAVQKRLPIYHLPNEQYVKSSNWVSITQQAVEHLLKRKTQIKNIYQYSLCGDEYFVASELTKADFKIHDEKKLLFQVWDGDGPRVLKKEDEKEMIMSGCLYARKFSAATLPESIIAD